MSLFAAAAPADASVRTLVMRHGPVELGGFQTKLPKVWVETPKVDGYVVGMEAEVVDPHGHVHGDDHVMLHHVVFINGGYPGGPDKQSSCPGRGGEPFYGTGKSASG